MQEYRNIRAIYPPSEGVIPKGCYSCGKDVKLDKGFVDMNRKPYKGYLCAGCTIVAIGGIKASMLLQYSQDTFRNSKI